MLIPCGSDNMLRSKNQFCQFGPSLGAVSPTTLSLDSAVGGASASVSAEQQKQNRFFLLVAGRKIRKMQPMLIRKLYLVQLNFHENTCLPCTFVKNPQIILKELDKFRNVFVLKFTSGQQCYPYTGFSGVDRCHLCFLNT